MSGCGRVVAVCRGSGGIPKWPINQALVNVNGIDGDAHRIPEHGGRNRALCLLSVEEVALLEAEGAPPQPPGGYGENLLMEGIDFFGLRPGMRLVLGQDDERMQIEIFDVRSPCVSLKRLDPRFPDLMLGRSGFLAKVLHKGTIFPGMGVSIIE